MFLILTEIAHLSTSLLVGWWFMDHAGWWGVIGALMVGFLVDSDHLIDYLLYIRDWKKISLKGFLTGEHFRKSGKLYIFFHGWEYGLVVSLCLLLLKNMTLTFSYWILVLVISNWLHLLVDQVTNDVNWNTYFITHRWLRCWRSEC